MGAGAAARGTPVRRSGADSNVGAGGVVGVGATVGGPEQAASGLALGEGCQGSEGEGGGRRAERRD